MKRTATLVSVALLAALSATPAMGQATIIGSAHDFSDDAWNPGPGTAGGEICEVCHTPHNGDQTVVTAPLWNHEVTGVTNFTPYSSTEMQSAPGQPNNQSKLCLSCHDGTVALDNFSGNTTGTNFIPANRDVGTDLSDDHPISFAYTAALATSDIELWDPTDNGHLTALGGTIQADLLFGDNLECASCHDVHNSGNTALLLVENTNSQFCLTCHKK
jgi:predicted CXXCH cytochrome family protein